MNTNTNNWAMGVDTPNMCEAVQRIAFSYGYRWEGAKSESKMGQKIYRDHIKFLLFYPSTKTMQFTCLRPEAEKIVSKVVTSLEEAVLLFNNPPEDFLVVGNVKITSNGSVIVADAVGMSAELFDEVVEKRRNFLAGVKSSVKWNRKNVMKDIEKTYKDV